MIKKNMVLLNAHQKTGQHWLVFLLANYHKILTENITETIPFKDTNFTTFGNPNTHLDDDIKEIEERGIQLTDFKEGFPRLKRSEAIWDEKHNDIDFHKLHKSFDKVIYLYRNPFDTMISLYYWYEKKYDLEELVKDRLGYYIEHLQKGFIHADVILCYEELREDPNKFKEALLLFFDEINEVIFQKALKMSSFESIHKINPKHARKGTVGQYREEMSKELIDLIKRECNKGGINLW